MVFDLDMIKNYYEKLPEKINVTRALLNRPITLSEKILYSHLFYNICLLYSFYRSFILQTGRIRIAKWSSSHQYVIRMHEGTVDQHERLIFVRILYLLR